VCEGGRGKREERCGLLKKKVTEREVLRAFFEGKNEVRVDKRGFQWERNEGGFGGLNRSRSFEGVEYKRSNQDDW